MTENAWDNLEEVEQYIKDLASVIKILKIEEPCILKRLLKEYGVSDPDESIVLEAFGYVYGMDWLENYYINHEEKCVKDINRGIV